MRLSDYTDYTMRVLMYCAAHPQRLVTIGELAQEHGLSRNHLMKIVTDLGRQGLLQTTRGRGGGLRLSRDAASIRVADVLRAAETDFRLVECFDASRSRCTLTPSCRLKGLLEDALQAYFNVLEGRTLADLVPPAEASTAPRAAPIRVLRKQAPEGRPRSRSQTQSRPRAAGRSECNDA